MIAAFQILGLWLLVAIILTPFAGMYLRFRSLDDGPGTDGLS